MIKKATVLLLLLILSIESFAAVVSDNDGSAFITKAEFDSLKNDFQSQIDQYNTSIDSKIDGAIAAYLAGIKVATADIQKILLYRKEVVSARGNEELNWKEGQINFGGAITVGRNPTNSGYLTGIYFIRWPGKNATEFKELLTEGQYYSQKGVFLGYYKTKQYVTVSGVNSGPSLGFGSNWASVGARVRVSPLDEPSKVTDFGAGEGTSLEKYTGSDGIIRLTTQNHQSYNIGAYVWVPWEGSTWKREITDTINDCVISTPIENSAGGFSRNDVINSFCNDDSSIAGFDGRKHTLITDGSGGMFDGNGSTTWQVNQNGTSNVNNNVVSGPLPVNSTRGGAVDMYAMYFGFCKHAKGWHHYSTKIYDDFLDDMKKYQTDSTDKLNVINTTPRNGGEAKDHLALTAGYPLIFAKKGQTVKYEIEFKDKTLKYDMWLKVGSFKSNEAVTAANAKNRITKVTGKAVSKSSLTNAFKYDGSKVSTIEFEMPKDGYVFMKWSKEGNNATGGGILLPKNEIVIIKQD